MILGYARVSTLDQKLDRQIDAIKKYGVEKIYNEKMSGTVKHRPELENLKEILRDGDIVVIESLNRLGRSSKDLLELLEFFMEKGVTLISLKESIDMSTPTGKLMISVLAALSQFERDTIVQRTNEGLVSARKRGIVGGRPKVDSKTIEKALKLYDSKAYTIREICELAKISQGTLYNEIKKRKKV